MCSFLKRLFAAGEIIKATKLTSEFEFLDFTSQYPAALMMFVIDAADQLTVMTTDAEVTPEAGQTVIALVAPAIKERS